MTSAELWASEIALCKLGLNLPKAFGHRHKLASNAVHIDCRKALQSPQSSSGEVVHLSRRRAKMRRSNFVILSDI